MFVQSLALIAGYCLLYGFSKSDFKLLELPDRGSLKYPSESVLESIPTLWLLFSAIEVMIS